MSRELNIDKIFREVADKHEEAYDPQDWNAFQGQLKSGGLQTKPSMASQVMKYIIKAVSTVVMIYMLPASGNLSQQKVTNKVINPSKQISKIEQAAQSNDEVLSQTSTKKSTANKPITIDNKNQVAPNKNISGENAQNKGIITNKTVTQKNAGTKAIGQNSKKNVAANSTKTNKGVSTIATNKTVAQKNTRTKTVRQNSKKQVTANSTKTNKGTNGTIATNKTVTQKNTGTKTVGQNPKKQVTTNSTKTNKGVSTIATNKTVTQKNVTKPTQPRVIHEAIALEAPKYELSFVSTEELPQQGYFVNNVDSIALQTAQAALKAHKEGIAWSQRPRNIIEQVGRWLRIVPNPKRIAQKAEKERLKAAEEKQLLAKRDSLAKISGNNAKLAKDNTTRKVKKNTFLGIPLPKVKINRLFSKFFKASDALLTSNTKSDSIASPYTIRPAQVGLVYPLGTNGAYGHKYSNHLSVNLFLGTAAALDGIEFGGFGNIEKDYVKGAQFAGFFNVAGKRVNGLQAAGFFNNAGGSLQGAQLAGFFNMAGVTSRKRSTNRSKFNLQAAGFGNLNLSDPLNFQGAGFFNVGRKIDGFQGAGFFNMGKEVNGFQGAGFANMAQKIEGVQISGFANIAQKVEGVQIAGLVNIAGKIKGTQIGILNIADSLTGGIPIGLLSIIRNGYRKFEVWGSESFHANVGYKIGVRKFYNIFAIGGQFLPNRFRWGVGYGIGTMHDLNAKSNINIEAMIYHVNENTFWEEKLRMLNQVKFLYGHEFNSRFSLHVGPTFNLLLSQDTPESNTLASELPPYTFFNQTTNGMNVKMWAGLQLGIRF